MCLTLHSLEPRSYTKHVYDEKRRAKHVSIPRKRVLSSVGGTDAVTFVVGGEKETFQGSRRKMASISPVFTAMFSGQWKEQETIVIPDVDPKGFNVLLR
jgi:hypothetical protein